MSGDSQSTSSSNSNATVTPSSPVGKKRDAERQEAVGTGMEPVKKKGRPRKGFEKKPEVCSKPKSQLSLYTIGKL